MEITFHHVLPVFETLCVWASQQETLCTNNTHYTANTHMNLSDSLFLLKLKKQMKLKTSFLYFHVINYIIIQFKLKGTFKSEAMFLEFSQSGPISLHPPSHSHTTVCLSIHTFVSPFQNPQGLFIHIFFHKRTQKLKLQRRLFYVDHTQQFNRGKALPEDMLSHTTVE